MNFDLVKKVLKRNQKNSMCDSICNDISTIDTSFISVPKISELNLESKEKVYFYLSKLNYDNYESITKYSDSLLNESNKERDYIIRKIDELSKILYRLTNKIKISEFIELIISREELLDSVEKIELINLEAELRTIALDLFIKKEEKRKYDFLGIFGKAERLRYLSNKNSLLNERKRLLTIIKLNYLNKCVIRKTLLENDELIKLMNKYIAIAISCNEFQKVDINMELRKVLDEIIIISYYFKNLKITEQAICYEHPTYIRIIDAMVDSIFDDNFDEKVRAIAKERKKQSIYSNTHNINYKKYIYKQQEKEYYRQLGEVMQNFDNTGDEIEFQENYKTLEIEKKSFDNLKNRDEIGMCFVKRKIYF